MSLPKAGLLTFRDANKSNILHGKQILDN